MILVLDIGANKGSFSTEILAHAEEALVLAVEPNFALFQEHLSQIAKNFPDRFLVDFRAVGETSDRGVLHHINSRGGQLASLTELNPNSSGWKREHLEFLDSDNSIVVDVVAPADLVDEYGLSDIHFIKIDIQGLDIEVLDGFLKSCHIRSGVVEVDCGFKKGDERYSDARGNDINRLFKILESKGLQVVKIIPNNEFSDELNVFFGESNEESIEIMTQLGISSNPAFARFWRVQGLGLSSQESVKTLSKNFSKKMFQGILHPFQSLESILVKLSR